MSLLPTLGDFAGLNPDTGLTIAGDEHLRQSLRDLLTTPIGSRVMRRTYGSGLFDQIDKPLSAGRTAKIVAATAEAIDAWEPRVTLKKIEVTSASAGELDLNLVVQLNGKTVRIEGVLQ